MSHTTTDVKPAPLIDPAGQIARLTRRLEDAEAAVDRWCHYQDRLREIIGHERFRDVQAAVTEGGWSSESLCPHKAQVARLTADTDRPTP